MAWYRHKKCVRYRLVLPRVMALFMIYKEYIYDRSMIITWSVYVSFTHGHGFARVIQLTIVWPLV